MRLGVLDVGSNTVHLLVVDAHRGGHPHPTYSEKAVLRLAESVSARGKLSDEGVRALVEAVRSAYDAVRAVAVDDLLAFATSAVRESRNGDKVLQRVRRETGVRLEVLDGEDEARLTFLAVRRWYGWSAGPLLAVDIGGGSLEIAAGLDESPELALSLPLGGGRLTRERLRGLPDGTPTRRELADLRAYVDATISPVAERVRDRPVGRAVGTSKTFRTLARLTGAAPSSAGPELRRTLSLHGLRQLVDFVSRIPVAELAGLDGVSANRAPQLLAGAVVAESAMRHLGLDEIDICPWALREGVILQRLDWLDGVLGDTGAPTSRAG